MAVAGGWRHQEGNVCMSEQEHYWKDLFEAPSATDTRILPTVWPVLKWHWGPIQVAEVAKQLKAIANGAPSLDGIKTDILRTVSPEEMTAHYNMMWLLCGTPPGKFSQAYTSLISKINEPTVPGDYRSNTVADMMERLFHQILAECLAAMFISLRQKAFRKGDG